MQHTFESESQDKGFNPKDFSFSKELKSDSETLNLPEQHSSQPTRSETAPQQVETREIEQPSHKYLQHIAQSTHDEISRLFNRLNNITEHSSDTEAEPTVHMLAEMFVDYFHVIEKLIDLELNIDHEIIKAYNLLLNAEKRLGTLRPLVLQPYARILAKLGNHEGAESIAEAMKFEPADITNYYQNSVNVPLLVEQAKTQAALGNKANVLDYIDEFSQALHSDVKASTFYENNHIIRCRILASLGPSKNLTKALEVAHWQVERSTFVEFQGTVMRYEDTLKEFELRDIELELGITPPQAKYDISPYAVFQNIPNIRLAYMAKQYARTGRNPAAYLRRIKNFPFEDKALGYVVEAYAYSGDYENAKITAEKIRNKHMKIQSQLAIGKAMHANEMLQAEQANFEATKQLPRPASAPIDHEQLPIASGNPEYDLNLEQPALLSLPENLTPREREQANHEAAQLVNQAYTEIQDEQNGGTYA